jgi:hypothetical protein
MVLLYALITSVILIALFVWYNVRSNNQHSLKASQTLENLKDFKATDSYISDSSGVSIAFDAERKKVCFLTVEPRPKILTYKDLLKSEIVIDGETVVSQSTTSTIGRALLGGLLAGGVGAIIGGATTPQKQVDKVNTINLKVYVNDPQSPIYKVRFLDAVGVKKGSFIYNSAHGNAEKWHGIIAALINQANKEENG